MKPEDAKAALVRAVQRAWPNVAKASELPFPDYWKKETEWLTFHAPHLGDKLIDQFISDMIAIAQEAERTGQAPKPWIVPEKVKEIWRKAEERAGTEARRPEESDEKREAWDHAAERAAAVKNRFPPRGMRQRSFL